MPPTKNPPARFLLSLRAMRVNASWEVTAFRFRTALHLNSSTRIHGSTSALDSPLAHSLGNSFCDRRSTRLLADLFALAREISRRNNRCASACPATNRARFLPFDRDGL